jgi:integrase
LIFGKKPLVTNINGGEEARRECPNCHSKKNWKDGLRQTSLGTAQRFICRDCGFRFSEKSYIESSLSSVRQLCVLNEAKKLDSATEIKTVAGDIEKTSYCKSNSDADIIEHIWWMKKQGCRESTIISRDVRLKRLVRLGADLNNPESVKEVIAKQTLWKESMKEVAVFAYDLFAKWKGIHWDKPRYKAVRELPFIPQEREIDDVMAGCNEEIVTFIQIGKLTGARGGEIFGLKWKDIDFERKTLSIVAEKNSNPRIFKIPAKLYERLKSLTKQEETIFNRYSSLSNLRRSYERQRNRTANRLGNPRLRRITFHTLRHWKGKEEYRKTKDLLHVQQTLGHKNIKNTLLYIQLANVEENSDYVCKVAKAPQEIQPLIEQGFEFVCVVDGLTYFRKNVAGL